MIRYKQNEIKKVVEVFVNGMKQGIIKTTVSKWIFYNHTRDLKSIEYDSFFDIRSAIESATVSYQ